MDPNPENRTEKLISGLVLGGLMTVMAGLFGAVIFAAPSMVAPHAVCVLVLCVGLLMIGAGVFYGVYRAMNVNMGPERAESNCRVMARYCVDESNNVVVADVFNEVEGVRTFVRMYSPTKGAMEFECAPPVWMQCGEGMLGHAITRGKWLSSFQPQMGPVQPRSTTHV